MLVFWIQLLKLLGFFNQIADSMKFGVVIDSGFGFLSFAELRLVGLMWLLFSDSVLI